MLRYGMNHVFKRVCIVYELALATMVCVSIQTIVYIIL